MFLQSNCLSFLFTISTFGGIEAVLFSFFRSTVIYVIPLVPCLMYAVYFGGFLIQFLIEKMGMMGAIPPPYG